MTFIELLILDLAPNKHFHLSSLLSHSNYNTYTETIVKRFKLLDFATLDIAIKRKCNQSTNLNYTMPFYFKDTHENCVK